MKEHSKQGFCRASAIVTGLIAVGFAFLIAREMPALRREWHIMRM